MSIPDIIYNTDSNRVTANSVNLPFVLAQEKRGPDSLAEYINHSDIPAGSTIMVLNRSDSFIVNQITNKFFIQGFSVSFREKAQLIETFGAASVSFFNDSIKVYQFNGTAIDYPSQGGSSKTMQQSSLMKLYNEHLRATKLINNNSIGLIKIFNHRVYGYPISLNVSYNAGADKLASFSMSWVVSKHSVDIPGLISNKQLSDLYTPNSIITGEANIARAAKLKSYIDAYSSAFGSGNTHNILINAIVALHSEGNSIHLVNESLIINRLGALSGILNYKIKDEVSNLRSNAQNFCQFLENEDVTPIQGLSTYEEFLSGLSSLTTLGKTVPFFLAFKDYYSYVTNQYNILLTLQGRN